MAPHPVTSTAPAPSAVPTATTGATCPAGTRAIPGGPFWVGAKGGTGASEESPRFRTDVAAFCLDETEVTVAAYAACVAAGRCTPAHDDRRFCNSKRPDHDTHPINCVEHDQAAVYCRSRGLRLPTEVEWELAARGGEEYRAFSWGNAPPRAQTCWQHPGGTCAVKSFAPGAFGLHDMSGNLWEWTDSGFGPYPWPPVDASVKVYRGGSWSRRFAKWLSPTLRNRWPTTEWGSHLGFRCAVTAPGARCPFAADADGRCLHGVLDCECPAGDRWNGARCAKSGAPQCTAGRSLVAGHGCVLDQAVSGTAPTADSTPVTRARSPEFDADCAAHQPGRGHAYRFAGGSHAARNSAGSRDGCKNRDVGVGWNSECCP